MDILWTIIVLPIALMILLASRWIVFWAIKALFAIPRGIVYVIRDRQRPVPRISIDAFKELRNGLGESPRDSNDNWMPVEWTELLEGQELRERLSRLPIETDGDSNKRFLDSGEAEIDSGKVTPRFDDQGRVVHNRPESEGGNLSSFRHN